MSVGFTCKHLDQNLGLLCPVHPGTPCRKQGDPRSPETAQRVLNRENRRQENDLFGLSQEDNE